ncbi:MAG: class I SAM-dependent methyltransferase [Bacteroidota bacterium]
MRDAPPLSMQEYDQIAAWYGRTRSRTIGIAALAELAASLTPGARVLDLGCGDGLPLSRFLVQEGFDVVGLDSSAEMVHRFRGHLPGVAVRCESAEDAYFAEGSFEAVVAWGVLFHLSESAQESVVHNVAAWLEPGGTFLFTSAEAEGVQRGTMDGVAFQYHSLGRRRYADLLERAGLHLETDYRDEGDNHTYVSRKTSSER